MATRDCESQERPLAGRGHSSRSPVVGHVSFVKAAAAWVGQTRTVIMPIFFRNCVIIGWTFIAISPQLCEPPSAADTPPFHNTDATEDGQWLMPAKDFANTRYSGLKEITTENVAKMQVAWTFSTGVNRGQEAAPIVVGDTMYVVTPYPNILYALDLKNRGSVKWKYEPKPEAAAQGVACCDVVNRGAVFSDKKLFFNTLDGHVCAVDAQTGKQAWKKKIGNINIGETMTMAPIVAKGKVLVGDSGGEF